MTQIRKREKTENKSILMTMMVIIMMFLFVGCSLAKENGEEDASAADNKDRLIGVFITNQSLDIEDKRALSVNTISG